MVFDGIDTGATCRALAAILQQPGDDAELYLERLGVDEVRLAGGGLESESRSEEGFAVRFLRGAGSWFACGDAFWPGVIDEAIRMAARVHPRTPRPLPAFVPPPAPPRDLDPLIAAVETLGAELGIRGRVQLRRHERSSRVLGAQLAGPEQRERFLSLAIEVDGARFSQLFAPEEAGELVARSLGQIDQRRRLGDATALADPGPVRVVLAPEAAAVVLHEAVGHALETDILAIGGRPDSAVGIRLGTEILNVLDDPGAAPSSVRRSVDDEGVAVVRRWLLRQGVVESPLADRRGAFGSERLIAGAARRATRFDRPGPRSTFLEVPAGGSSFEDLLGLVGEGVLVSHVDRGSLDPTNGRFVLDLPGCRRIRSGTPAEMLGPCRLVGQVAGLLAATAGIGREPQLAGAGWCAKDGQLLGVWARTPAIAFVGGLEVAR